MCVFNLEDAMRGLMTLEVSLANNGFAELTGSNIKYWAGEGLPTFEGPLDGFEVAFPDVMVELIERKAVKVS